MRTGKRLTGSYDADEDRIRLAVLDEQDSPLALWITQRLANRLVKGLVKLLEKNALPGEISAPNKTAMQAFQQASSDLRMQRGRSVQAPPETELGLVTNVAVRPRKDTIILEFSCGNGESVAMPLGMTPLRQFLRVLHRLYIRADWPGEDIWPDWLTEENSAKTVEPSQIN